MISANRYYNLKPLLFVLVLLPGCRSERAAFRFQPAAREGLVETVEIRMPVTSAAPASEAQLGAALPATQCQVLSRPLAHPAAGTVRHKAAQIRLAHRRNPKKTKGRPESITSISHSSGYRLSNALFVGGFIVALLGLFAAFTMPTFGLGVLVFLGGLLLGLIVTTIGFVTGYGKGPGGMR